MRFGDLPIDAQFQMNYDNPTVWVKVDEDFGRELNGSGAVYMFDPNNTVVYPCNQPKPFIPTYNSEF